MSTFQQTFGQRVRELRTGRDMSLRELGAALGKLLKSNPISAAFLSDIEQGHRFPSAEILKELAKALKTTEEDLKKYDYRPPTQKMQELININPQYGYAFRKIVDYTKKEGLEPQELIDRLSREDQKKKKP